MAKKIASATSRVHQKKKTSIGHSTFTRFSSKHDKRNKKKYRGQGR